MLQFDTKCTKTNYNIKKTLKCKLYCTVYNLKQHCIFISIREKCCTLSNEHEFEMT